MAIDASIVKALKVGPKSKAFTYSLAPNTLLQL